MALLSLLKAAWNYRRFIISSILAENKARFARSKLGWLCMIINPLAQAAVLALVLSKILNAKFPGIDNEYAYALYLLSGILGWSLFSEVTVRCLNIFRDNANVLKKINFPRISLPIIVAGSALLNHILLLVCTVAIFLILGQGLSVVILWLPLVIIINLAFALGLGLFLGIMNVFIRDIGQAFPIILQFWFWLTQIVYHVDMLPHRFREVLEFSPMFYVIQRTLFLSPQGATPPRH